MLSRPGLPAPAASRCPSGTSWQPSRSVVSSKSGYLVAAATNCKSVLRRADTAGGERGRSWQRGGRGEPERSCRWREESLCSTSAPASREEGRVPSVLVLPPLCDGAQRHRPPIASPSAGWRGAAGNGCVTPAGLCKMGSSASSCLRPASRAAFPFGFGGRLLVPRQRGEDLALAGVQAALIPPSVSGSSSRFPDIHQNTHLRQSRLSEHSGLLSMAGMAKARRQALPDCFPIPFPAKRC